MYVSRSGLLKHAPQLYVLGFLIAGVNVATGLWVVSPGYGLFLNAAVVLAVLAWSLTRDMSTQSPETTWLVDTTRLPRLLLVGGGVVFVLNVGIHGLTNDMASLINLAILLVVGGLLAVSWSQSR